MRVRKPLHFFLHGLFGLAFLVYVVLAVWASVYDPQFWGPDTIKKLDLLLWWFIGCGSVMVYMTNRGRDSREEDSDEDVAVKKQAYVLVGVMAVSAVVLWRMSDDFGWVRYAFVPMAMGLLALSWFAALSEE